MFLNYTKYLRILSLRCIWKIYFCILPSISVDCLCGNSFVFKLTLEYENAGLGGNDGTGDSGDDPSSAPEIEREDVAG